MLLTLGIIATTGWGFERLWTIHDRFGRPIDAVNVRLIASQLLILVTFMFAGVLALSAAMVAAPSISSEVESGLMLSLVSRPVRRLDVTLGKWLGLAVLVAGYAAGSGVLELLVVKWTTGYVPPHPAQLIACVAGQGLVLLSLALLLSTRLAGMTGGIVALVGYFAAWIGGIVAGIGQALNNDALTQAGVLSKLIIPTDALWRGAVYSMEPVSILSLARAAGPAGAANPFVVADPIAPAMVAWSVFWVVAVIALTAWSFSRKEL